MPLLACTHVVVIQQDRDVFADSHDGTEGHGALVQRLEEVRDDHDGKHTSVDELLQALVLFLGDDHSTGGVGVLCDFVVHTVVIDVVDFGIAAGQRALNLGGILTGVFLVGSADDVRRSLNGLVAGSGHLCGLPRG